MSPVLSESYVRGMVSIVIPTYNRAGFIRESINSALTQDYSSFEVIVVDDGSIDITPRICGEYGDKIRYFSKPNGGPASALNFGIRKMRGEWYKPLDSDDVLEPSALTAFVEYATTLGSNLLYCDAILMDEAGHLLRASKRRRDLRGDEFLRALWSGRSARRGFAFGGPASGLGMIHRSVLTQVGLLNETLRMGEDWEWQLRSCLVHGLHETHIPQPLYRIRYHQGNLTRSKHQKALAEGQVRSIVRDQITQPGEISQSLMSHYRAETKRLQRTYLPIVPIAKTLARAPGYPMLRSAAWIFAPGLSDCIYWAANPPV